MYNDHFWWNRARTKLNKVAKKFKVPYTKVAYYFAAMCYRNTIPGARKCLLRYLKDGYLGHKAVVGEWINLFDEYGAVTPSCGPIYRALMGDESEVPFYHSPSYQLPWELPAFYETNKRDITRVAFKHNVTPLQCQAEWWAESWRASNTGKRLPYV